MKIGNFDLNKNVLVVAEIGNNHEGDFNLAKEMVRVAAQTGVGAVKFQSIIPDSLVSPLQKERVDQLSRYAFSKKQFFQLAEIAHEEGILFLSTPFCLETLKWIQDIVPAIKIASGDNNYHVLLQAVGEIGKPVILSTGMATESDIQQAYQSIESGARKSGHKTEIILLHCVSAYPTPPDQANLKAILSLSSQFQCMVGYSDHTLGIDAALLSVALGGRLIEKHFTLSKNQSTFRDHALSVDPGELTELVRRVKETEQLLGDGSLQHHETESSMKLSGRRSIVAKENLPAGHDIRLEDLTWLRPGDGLKPGEEYILIGRTLKRNVVKGEKLTLEVLV